jgi:hypothetical protein
VTLPAVHALAPTQERSSTQLNVVSNLRGEQHANRLTAPRDISSSDTWNAKHFDLV